MEFSSLTFLFIFMPFFLFLFFVFKKEAHHSFLLIASLAFYAWGEGEFVLLLLLSIIINYFLGLLVDIAGKKFLKKSIFLLAVFFNLGLLVYYKYTHFILANLGLPGTAGTIHLPIGISFFTFQALSFLIDIYRKTVPMDRNPMHFGVYMALFPKLAMGPITPYHNLREQIKNQARQPRWEDVAEGVKRFIFGLGKKVLLADVLARPANGIFSIPAADQTAGLAWLGIICFTMQIYYDFSGYTDMAVGLGRMCGYTLPENFNYPYIARSIKEFWQRWHISLAHWLRDYLFLPIAYTVSRKIKSPRVLGVKAENWAYFTGAFFTFLICGVWHGAAWTFVIWGAYYGLLLVGEHAARMFVTGMRKRARKQRSSRPPQEMSGSPGAPISAPKDGPKGLLRWWSPATGRRRHNLTVLKIAGSQLLVMIGWVIFRSAGMGYAVSYLQAMAGIGGGDGIRYYPALYLDAEVFFFIILGLIGIFPVFPKLKEWYEAGKARKAKPGARLIQRLLHPGYVILYNLYLTGIFFLSIMVITGGTYNPFIYFRF